MSTLTISLFGTFAASYQGRPIAGLEARKVQELFCYLLLYRDQPHQREALAGLLWGDMPSAQARKALRQTLWQLQSALHSHLAPKHQLLEVSAEAVQVTTTAQLALDVAAFEQACRYLHNAQAATLVPAAIAELQQAVELYQGSLLEGWYHDWCLFERERFENMYLELLDQLMLSCEALGEYKRGLDYGARVLRHDRAHERTYRRMMRLFFLDGNRSGALRQYERCVAALDEELGVEPSQQTQALHRAIQADHLDGSPQPVELSMLAHTPLRYLLERLKKLEGTLGDALLQVQHDLEAIERVINRLR